MATKQKKNAPAYKPAAIATAEKVAAKSAKKAETTVEKKAPESAPALDFSKVLICADNINRALKESVGRLSKTFPDLGAVVEDLKDARAVLAVLIDEVKKGAKAAKK